MSGFQPIGVSIHSHSAVEPTTTGKTGAVASTPAHGTPATQTTRGTQGASQQAVVGISEVAVCVSEHGIARKHIAALAKHAQENNLVFVLRAENPHCAEFLERGYRIIPAGVPLKTETGNSPLAGLVPAEPPFGTALAAEAAEAAGAARVRLHLPAARIAELRKCPELQVTNGAAGSVRMAFKRGKNKYTFSASPAVAGGLHPVQHEGKPVQVWGRKDDDRVVPYVDGYELVMCCPHGSQPAIDGEPHVEAMNAALGRADDNPAIRPAASRSRSDGADMFPCLVFAPKSAGIDDVAYVPNADALGKLLAQARDAGFTVPADTGLPEAVKNAMTLASGSNGRKPGSRPPPGLARYYDSFKQRPKS